MAHQASTSFTIPWNLLKLMSIESVMPSNYIKIPFSFCFPLLLPSIFLSIRVFCNKLALHIKEPKFWSFSIGQKYLFPNIFLIYGDSCFAAASNMCIECLMDITTKGVRQRSKKVQNMHSRELCSRFDSLGQEIGALGK